MTAIRTAAYAAVVSILPLAGAASAQNQPADRPGDRTGQAQPAGQAQTAGDKHTGGDKHSAGDKHQNHGKQMSVEQATTNWPDGPKKAAKMMSEKHGDPNGVTPTRLVWTDKGPFKEIILLNEEIQHDFPMPHKDYLQHVVEFKVPTDKVGELAEFDGSIIVDRTRGTIGARCDTEAHNLLALNLAYDILNGKKNVEEARKAYAEIAKAEMMGKQHDYLSKLTFQPMPNAGDAGVALMEKPQAGEAQPAAAQEPAAAEPADQN